MSNQAATQAATCSVCKSKFDVRFRYQIRQDGRQSVFVCSPRCHERLLRGANDKQTCSVCSSSFKLEFAYQVAVTDGEKYYYCTPQCRENAPQKSGTLARSELTRPARQIAVFNHKGGTGKTTTAINLAAGMAEAGKRVLLIDADSQGNVGVSLGIHGDKSLYHILVSGASAREVAVPVRQNFDVVTSNELVAAAEIFLVNRPNRDRVLRDRLGRAAEDYDVVILDCAPALSLMNQNALVYADSLLIPVSCDYLSLVGVKQVLRTVKHVRELLKHPVEIIGVLPTFYDQRVRISRESIDVLRSHFGERCMHPIRANTKLKEAPTEKQTIFEYAPESHGAADYARAVQTILRLNSELEGDQKQWALSAQAG